jgi:hypothetical protein
LAVPLDERDRMLAVSPQQKPELTPTALLDQSKAQWKPEMKPHRHGR